MKLLTWNTHRLGYLTSVQTLHNLIKKEVPNLVFLQENKLGSWFFYVKKFSFGFSNCSSVDCVDTMGALAVLLNENVKFEVLRLSKAMIHGRVRESSSNPLVWLLIGVYGHPKTKQ